MVSALQSGHIEFHVAADNPVLDGLAEDDLVRLNAGDIRGLFQIDLIDHDRPQMLEGIKCVRVRLKGYTIYRPYVDGDILDAEIIE